MKNAAFALTALALFGCESAPTQEAHRAPAAWYKFQSSCREMATCRQKQIDVARDAETLCEISDDSKGLAKQHAYRLKLEECLRADKRTLDLITEAISLCEQGRIDEANTKLDETKRAAKDGDRLDAEADELFARL